MNLGNKRFWSGTSVLLVVFGMIIAGCDNGSINGDGNTDPKQIIITDIDAEYVYSEANADIYLFSSASTIVAEDSGKVAGDTFTFNLRNSDTSEDWTGNGRYWILLKIGPERFYTNGDDISIDSLEEMVAKAPKYNIVNTVTTIPFYKFK